MSIKIFLASCVALFFSLTLSGQHKVEVEISASEDDVEEHGETSSTPGAMYFDSSDLEMVYDTTGSTKRGAQTIGLRFNNISVPKDAYLVASYIQFTADAPSDVTTNLTIRVQDTSNAQAFTVDDYNVSARTKTDDSVQWLNIPAWDAFGESGDKQKTPGLNNLLNGIFSKSNWSSGNSAVLIIQGEGIRRAASWDEPDLSPPKLVMEYYDDSVHVSSCDYYVSPSDKIWTISGTYVDTLQNQFGGDSLIFFDLTVKNSTASSISESVCKTYISPSGKVWTNSGIYKDTILNTAGCDSIITIDLTINQTASDITKTACDRYVSPGGKEWTVSGIYTDTIPNTLGCDSIITVDLTVNTTTMSNISETVCESYTSPSGKLWTASGIYNDTIPNTLGCDSIISIDLTVNKTTTSTISETVCESYISPGGKLWTVSGIYMDTIPNVLGCDSIITVDLTVNSKTTSNITEAVCDSYVSPSGKEWTESGIYTDTISNTLGCDSLISIDLTVNLSSFSDISEMVSDSYTSPSGLIWTETGIYNDTILNVMGCDSVITVDLVVDYTLSIVENEIKTVSVYPNPTRDVLFIELEQWHEKLTVEIIDLEGKLHSSKTYWRTKGIYHKMPEPPGTYILKMYEGTGRSSVFRVIKK